VTTRTFSLDDAVFAGRTGRGVKVAVLDSGLHPGNPHVHAPAAAVHFTDAAQDDDALDRLGHGTAVAAAILEKAPGIELVVVRVFDRELATTTEVLVRAIAWAVAHGCRLINLSLGTPNPDREPELRAGLERAIAHGAILVSAREFAGTRWLPGCLPGAAGVLLDDACPRDQLRLAHLDDETVFHASGLPRPIPGVPPERNVWGISFAVANVTGFLARTLEGRPALRTVADVLRLLVEESGRMP
jgi:hypothetical protein